MPRRGRSVRDSSNYTFTQGVGLQRVPRREDLARANSVQKYGTHGGEPASFRRTRPPRPPHELLRTVVRVQVAQLDDADLAAATNDLQHLLRGSAGTVHRPEAGEAVPRQQQRDPLQCTSGATVANDLRGHRASG